MAHALSTLPNSMLQASDAAWFASPGRWPVVVLGLSALNVPSTLTTTARPGDPRNCPEGLPCTYTIIREAHTWGFAPIRQYTRV